MSAEPSKAKDRARTAKRYGRGFLACLTAEGKKAEVECLRWKGRRRFLHLPERLQENRWSMKP